jgi:hypothetical protein
LVNEIMGERLNAMLDSRLKDWNSRFVNLQTRQNDTEIQLQVSTPLDGEIRALDHLSALSVLHAGRAEAKRTTDCANCRAREAAQRDPKRRRHREASHRAGRGRGDVNADEREGD